MSVAEHEAYAGLTDEQREQLYAYRLALRLHDGRWLAVLKIVPFPTPAAGSEFSFQTPAGVTWIPLSILATFSASAVVANRTVQIQYRLGNVIYYRSTPVLIQAASNVFQYTWSRGWASAVVAGGTRGVGEALPSIPIVGGSTIQSSTVSLDVGDAYSGLSAYVIEVRERTANEMVNFAEDLASGAHVDNFPGLLLGL